MNSKFPSNSDWATNEKMQAPQPPHRIYINPNFHQIEQGTLNGTVPHINPLFLQSNGNASPAIHMNPKFLEQKIREQRLLLLHQASLKQDVPNPKEPIQMEAINAPKPSQKLITKSRTKIVREPMLIKHVSDAPLLSLSKRKLVRRALHQPSSSDRVTSAAVVYKIDHRFKVRRRSFVGRYALRRALGSKNQISSETSKKLSPSFSKYLALGNKKLQLLNISGVMYKSSRNKLQREDVCNRNMLAKDKSTRVLVQQNLTSGRTLFVRGAKFVMDPQGFKLTRVAPIQTVPSSDRAQPYKQRLRIDIGGLTYVASNTKNVFVRTRNHLTLAHLNSAKHRSLQLLTRNLVKSNIPCAIYQRLGKCIASERGKCSKVHNKQQISICPRFLRGECYNTECLLSHNVSLSKMPVCKFFLQGVCVRSDCPYLHKKLSQQTEICEDFLRGYCKHAEKCRKRHEFLCPRYERNGKCEATNCEQCKSKKRSEKCKQIRNVPPKDDTDIPVIKENDDIAVRYFKACPDGKNETNTTLKPVSIKSRPKVGALPAFIPLS